MSANRLPDKPTLDGIEARWASAWEEQGTYDFDRSATRDRVFSIDTPPPTVSGSLHVGQQHFGVLQELPARVGQHHASAGAHEERDAPRSVMLLEERVAALRGQGAGDDEIFRTRAKALDTAAASRLAAVDQEERAWRSRMDAYLAERVRLLARLDNAPESEKTTALAALQTENFSELERKRLAAYEP